MVYDPNSPATTHAGLSDCDKIRANCNELRKFEASATEPSNPVAGMMWLYTPGSGDWILKERNKDNDAWIDMIRLTSSGSPKAHIESNITSSNMVHGVKQGSGNGFDADKLDGKEGSEYVQIGSVGNEYLNRTGTNEIAGANPAKAVTETEYTKKKEIKLNKTPDTTLKIYFVLNIGSGAGPLYGKIYRNGSPVGTERSKSGTGAVAFTEEISGWSNGDLLQLYAYVTGTPIAYVQEFKILGTRRINVELD